MSLWYISCFNDREITKSTSTTHDIPWNNEMVLKMIASKVNKTVLPVSHEQGKTGKPAIDTVTIYTKAGKDGTAEAYGFFLNGKGLWGSIEAFVAVSSDLKKMVGIDFTKQVETPGLGARITEQEFK